MKIAFIQRWMCLIILSQICIVNSSFSTLYAKVGEDAHFGWKMNMEKKSKDDVNLIWIRKTSEQYRNTTNVLPFRFPCTGDPRNDSVERREEFAGCDENGDIKFIVKKTLPSDVGFYFTDFDETTGQELVLMDVPDKPIVEEIKESEVNQTLELQCLTKSNSISVNTSLQMTVNWKIDDETIITGERFNVSGSALAISPIRQGDSGKVVTCFAYECCNVTSEQSNIYILFPKYGPSSVHFTPSNTTYHVNVGTQLENITGTAACNPDCTYYWTRKSNDLYTWNGTTLHLGSITDDEYGIYVFHAENVISETTKCLNVIRKNDFSKGKMSRIPILVMPTTIATIITICSIVFVICIVRIRNRRQKGVVRKSETGKISENKFALKHYDGSYRDNELYVPCEPHQIPLLKTSNGNNGRLTTQPRHNGDRKPFPCPRQFGSMNKIKNKEQVNPMKHTELSHGIETEIYSKPDESNDKDSDKPLRLYNEIWL